MRYILVDEERRINAIKELQGLSIVKPVEVTIKPYKRKRSNSQNNLYHMWKRPIADHFGMTEDELHKNLKVKFLGVKKERVMGEDLVVPISTKSLDPDKMATFLTMVEVLAGAYNIRLQRPDDYNLAMGVDITC